MRRLSLRRFPREIVRRRQASGYRDENGRFVPGRTEEAVLPASVQPISLDADIVPAGARLSERLVALVPVGIERRIVEPTPITWDGDVLLWNGEPFTWGGLGEYVDGDLNPLGAAFDSAGADRAVFADHEYIVDESTLWRGSHCRAVLLRET